MKQLPYVCDDCQKQLDYLDWLRHEQQTGHHTSQNPEFNPLDRNDAAKQSNQSSKK